MKVPKNWNPKRPFVAIAISLWRHSNFLIFTFLARDIGKLHMVIKKPLNC